MRRISWFLFFWLVPVFWASGQEPEGLEVFYGKKDFKGASLGYEYLLGTEGGISSLELYYLTQSKKSQQAKHWPLYYGVSLEFAYGEGRDYEFDDYQVDFSAWWVFLWIEGKVFAQDYEKVRPYFDFGAGLGTGQFAAEGEELEIDWRGLDLAQLRLGAGVEIMLEKNYALDLEVSGKGMLGVSGNLLEFSDLLLGGVQVNLGLSKWSERK